MQTKRRQMPEVLRKQEHWFEKSQWIYGDDRIKDEIEERVGAR